MTKDPYYLIYDWNCTLCVNLMKFIKKLDRKNDIVFVPFDDPLVQELIQGMSQEKLKGSFHLILPEGSVLSGDQAIPYVIGALPGGKIPQWILLHFPGRKFLLKAFYKGILKIREQNS